MFYAQDRDIYLKQIMPADKWFIHYNDGTKVPVVAFLLFDFWSDSEMLVGEELPEKKDLISGNYTVNVKIEQIIRLLLANGIVEDMLDECEDECFHLCRE